MHPTGVPTALPPTLNYRETIMNQCNDWWRQFRKRCNRLLKRARLRAEHRPVADLSPDDGLPAFLRENFQSGERFDTSQADMSQLGSLAPPPTGQQPESNTPQSLQRNAHTRPSPKLRR